MQRTSYLLASKFRPRRSTIFVPGSNIKALSKVRTSALPCDSYIIDLEDAVASNSKSQARENVRKFLCASTTSRNLNQREIMVRINALDTRWGLNDLSMVSSSPGVDTVVVPKVETASDIWRIERHLEEMSRSGSSDGGEVYSNDSSPIGIACMIETPLGVLNAPEIAAASKNIVCLIVGTSDLTNDLRAHHTTTREPILTSLSMCVLAARASNVAVLDGVHLNLSNENEFQSHCVQGYHLGFDGKTLIHPKQISIANDTFGPNAKQVEHAIRIVDAFEEAEKNGDGVCVVDGQLVENLHAEGARRVLQYVKKINNLEKDDITGKEIDTAT
jgi:citrate lyase subunit beta/citryl-CoA lyase